MKKILFATVVPFWNRETGAQQRIFSLVKALESHGHQVRIFFPVHTEPADQEIAQDLGLNVSFERSDQPAANQTLTQKIKWQIEAVKHAVGNPGSGRGRDADQHVPLCLDDFRWPWAESAFKNAVIEFVPDVVISEYITMAYLVESLPGDLRSKIHCMVDTHDLLSLRQQQFVDHDRPHWIDVSPEEEATALKNFDTIIAIQADEAAQLETLAPEIAVIVVGHQTLVADTIGTQPRNESDVFTVGYLGSSNSSNVDAINAFLDSVWRKFKGDQRIRLVVAGNVSEGVPLDLQFENVQLLGHVANERDFYDLVDVVVNPVGYGTGLKIKSVEAVAYGKPLLCTSAGWKGSPVGGVIVVDQLQQMSDAIVGWLNDVSSFEPVSQAAYSCSKQTDDWIYQPLLELL